MRVVTEAGEEVPQVLVEQRVLRDPRLEVVELGLGRKLAVDQQVRRLEEARLLGKLVDRVAAVAQDPRVAVDERDLRRTCRGVAEARVERDPPGGRQQLSELHAGRRLSAVDGVEREYPARVGELVIGHLRLPWDAFGIRVRM